MAGRGRGWGRICATESRTSLERRPTKADNCIRLNVSGIFVNGNGVLVLDPQCECGSRPLWLKLAWPYMQVGLQAKGWSSCQPGKE